MLVRASECRYIYIGACVSVCVCVCVGMSVRVCECIGVFVCMYVCVFSFVRKSVFVHMCMLILYRRLVQCSAITDNGIRTGVRYISLVVIGLRHLCVHQCLYAVYNFFNSLKIY